MKVSRRTERIGSVIRAVLSHEIQMRLSDPRIETLTSITRVEVAADLSVARVYVSVMAPEARQRLCLTALQHAAGRLRAAVGRQVRLRQLPQLVFHLDDSIQRAFQTVQQIDAAMAELEARAARGGSAAALPDGAPGRCAGTDGGAAEKTPPVGEEDA